MRTYITTTQYNTYQYRRRVPKLLYKYIPHRTIKVSLGAVLQEAQIKAIKYDKAIEEALEYIKASLPLEYILDVVKIFNIVAKKKPIIEKRWDVLTTNYISTKEGVITVGEINKLKDFVKRGVKIGSFS